MSAHALLVFDWDGTLADSHGQIIACMQAAAAELNADPLPPAAVRQVIGLGLEEAIQALYPHADARFRARFARAYRGCYLSLDAPPALFEGVPEMLAALEGEGYLLAVATGKGREGLARALAQTGLGGRFHVTRCADETFSKPHPAMLEDIMDYCGVEPQRTLMIGDSRFDLEMAYHAGVDSVAVAPEGPPSAELMQWKPRGVLRRIDALPAWLRARSAAG